MDTLTFVAVASLLIGGICTVVIMVDLLTGHRQSMGIMNIVWPVTTLYCGPLGLFAYYTIGRKSSVKRAMRKKATNHSDRKKPFWQSVIVGALHCGSGCTLGDILAESILFHFPVVLFGRELFGSWAIDYILAFLIGIVFQYYAIKPIKDLTRRQAIVAALKADTLSLTSWQIGMYGWMAVATFLIFRHPLSAAGSGVLAHNADRYANGLHYRISSQLVVVEERN